MRKKLKKYRENRDFVEIFGIHAVQAAIKNNKRIHQKLIISENLKEKLKNLRKFVNEITFVPNTKFNKIYGYEKNHQGIILKTSKIQQPTVEDILDRSKEKKNEIVIMLDQVTDPQNIGSIMRSCALLNCKSIIVSKNHAPDITASMAKAASGTIEIVNYLKVTNLARTIQQFKKNNFWAVGFINKTNNSIATAKLPNKCLFIFGAEGKGLRELTIKECDETLKIPINLNTKFGIESLNVANACSIALYEFSKLNSN